MNSTLKTLVYAMFDTLPGSVGDDCDAVSLAFAEAYRQTLRGQVDDVDREWYLDTIGG